VTGVRLSVSGARVERVAANVVRPNVPDAWVERLDSIMARFPETTREPAWVGMRWRVRQSTVAHLFGGEDQLFRITFRADPAEVLAFEHLGLPYFKAGWGGNVVGLLLDERTDWDELAELVTDSYCLQAPPRLAERVGRP
jgi:hypothetical protein